MNDRRFALGSVVNLITLIVGLAIGFVLGNLEHMSVHAQAVLAPTPQVQDVVPTITAGSVGTNLVLAHEIDADKIVVNESTFCNSIRVCSVTFRAALGQKTRSWKI